MAADAPHAAPAPRRPRYDLLSQSTVAVVGLGKSGLAVVRFLLRRGATVLACDDRDRDALAPTLATLGDLLHSARLRLCLGGLSGDVLLHAQLVVVSPGVPPTRPALARARDAGIPITGEIELAAHFVRAPIVGITGTNGKSTVTSLCGAIATATGRPTFCGGNLGTPLIAAVDEADRSVGPDGIVVCELSSYQLETADTLAPIAATVLNLTPDHLDRYPSFAAYGDAKGRIFANMPVGTAAPRVLSGDDPDVLAMYARTCGTAPALLFSTRHTPAAIDRSLPHHLTLCGWVDDARGDLVLSLPHTADSEERYPIAELQIIGRHNLGNALAAFLLMRAAGLATYEQTRRAAATFLPLPHRMQLVGEVDGIRYYDDSKGTNVDAVVAGLDGFPRPLALIAGGRDKGGSYAPLRDVLCRLPAHTPCRGIIVIGEAAPLITQAFAGCPFPVVPAATMPEAVARATALCRPGDAVVLSPACSSFDMFRDYAHRAQVFVESLPHPTHPVAAPAPHDPARGAHAQ